MTTTDARVDALLDNMHEDACPDCDAPPGRSCHWWCPRYADVLYDDEEEVPDGR